MDADWNTASFTQECESWLCSPYSCDIRYVARRGEAGSENEILVASITFSPQPNPIQLAFQMTTKHLLAGQMQLPDLNLYRIKEVLTAALEGQISLGNERLVLPYSNITHRRVMSGSEQWFQHLQVKVSSQEVGAVARVQKPNIFTPALDDELRRGDVPFDGFDDLIAWLMISDPRFNNIQETITITVDPPAQLMVDECRLENDRLDVVVIAHPKMNHGNISLGVRGAPGGGITSRRRLAGSDFVWDNDHHEYWKGKISTTFDSADQALAILMIGEAYVRRHWFTDQVKARNNRFVAMQAIDKDLKQLRRYLLSPDKDQDKFERAVADLLFLRGYNPVIPLETDAPDILMMTPGGQLALVECTLSVKDAPTKLGKLVARRGEIRNAMTVSGHSPEIAAILVCLSPRDHIGASYDQLMQQQIKLWSREDLEDKLLQLRFPADVDKELLDIKRELATVVNS